jgi:secreted Zn-dependent insulinase-like peptidase
MNSNFQYFSLNKNDNDNREMRGIILSNGIKIILISDIKTIKSCCSVGVGIGSLHDSHEGIAHFLEHLLFMGNEKYKNQNDYHSYVKNSGGYDNAYTSDEETCYFLILESQFLKKGIEMLSWFFKAPLLQECHVESERNIVNSEHEKNILSDMWIEDSLSKFFYKENNRYRRFSTGNNKSLKNVTHNDAYDFYKKYYTTDNLFICIVDSKDLDFMEKNYIPFFDQIEKSYHSKIKLEEIEYLKNDLIIYESISNYNTLDVKIILNCDKHNREDNSVINFILFILFTKFTKSLSYYLLEDNYIYDINNQVNFLYEKYCVLTLEMYFEPNNNLIIINKMKKSLNLINEYLVAIENLSEKEFFVLYENYINIIKMNYYFNKNKDVSDISLEITNNMLNNINKEELLNSVIAGEIREKYSLNLFKKYQNILKNRQLKIITNVNVLNIKSKDYIESKWYNAKYYLDFVKNFYKFKNYESKYKFNFKNLIDKEFQDADNLLIKFKNETKIKNNKIPTLIYNNNKIKRKILLIKGNYYDSPLSGISVIRKNNQYDKETLIIFSIYEEIYIKLLIYYLEVEGLHLSNFNLKIGDNELMYNFKGIFELDIFVKNIFYKISYKNIIKNKKFDELFDLSIKVILQFLENEKYSPPFSICQKYFNIHIKNDMKQDEAINYIKLLTNNIFKQKLKKILEYEEEYILIFANTILKSNDFISKINNAVPIDKNLIILNKTPGEIKNIFNFNKNNYIISKSFITPDEINNCLLDFYILKEIKLDYVNCNTLEKKSLISYITYSLISDFIVDLLTDKLFDKLRTIEKLGYIVRVSKNQVIKNKNIIMGFSYLIQSTFSIDRIQHSIDEFNNITIKNINFKTNFENLKKNKIVLLKKDFETFDQEASFIISNVSFGTYNYDIKNLFIGICEKITYKQIFKIIQNITTLNKIQIIINIKNNK